MDASSSSRTAEHHLHLHGEEEAGVSNNHCASSSSPPDRWPGPAEAGERPPLLLHDNADISDDTAHQISADPWYQAGFVLATAVNSVYVLGYPGSVMVPLGWVLGTSGLVLAAAISL